MGSDSDLKIHHDGSHSRIEDLGTGNLKLASNGTAVQIEKSDGENMAVFRTDGAAELYFDNSKKVETPSGGLKVTGITTLTNRLHVQAGVSTFDADVRLVLVQRLVLEQVHSLKMKHLSLWVMRMILSYFMMEQTALLEIEQVILSY